MSVTINTIQPGETPAGASASASLRSIRGLVGGLITSKSEGSSSYSKLSDATPRALHSSAKRVRCRCLSSRQVHIWMAANIATATAASRVTTTLLAAAASASHGAAGGAAGGGIRGGLRGGAGGDAGDGGGATTHEPSSCVALGL